MNYRHSTKKKKIDNVRFFLQISFQPNLKPKTYYVMRDIVSPVAFFVRYLQKKILLEYFTGVSIFDSTVMVQNHTLKPRWRPTSHGPIWIMIANDIFLTPMNLFCWPFFCGSFVLLMSCVCHAFASVHCCLVVTCWERADLLSLVCDV